MTKYKLYYTTESGDFGIEFYTKKELLKHKRLDDDGLFEMAEHMVFNFNRNIDDDQEKRYCYKLEVVSGDAFYHEIGVK